MASREESGGKKERRIKAYETKRSKSRIYLYEQFATWRQLKEELNLVSDEQLAAILLNDYFSRRRRDRRPIPWYVDYNKLYVYTIIYNYIMSI
jgi:hypothetical protein